MEFWQHRLLPVGQHERNPLTGHPVELRRERTAGVGQLLMAPHLLTEDERDGLGSVPLAWDEPLLTITIAS